MSFQGAGRCRGGGHDDARARHGGEAMRLIGHAIMVTAGGLAGAIAHELVPRGNRLCGR
jgi:hypothetical protein